jgi:RNA polymerase sigma factor (sigma-70 family)
MAAKPHDGGLTPVSLRSSERHERDHQANENGNIVTEATWEAELQSLATGDFTAFWRLWEGHQKYLYRICLQQLGGVPEEAEDAHSRLLIKLWDLLPRHASRIKNFRAWITRITHNLCIDIHRERRQTNNTKSLDNLTEGEDHALLRAADSPEEIALTQEINRYLYDGVNELASKLRIPFLLHFLHDIPYGEIAAQLSITPENARKRGQLARDVLRERLKNYISGLGHLTGSHNRNNLYPFLEASLIAEQTQQAPGQQGRAETVSLRLVKVVLNSGIERSFYIQLDHKPLKLYPKIETVTRYTSNHPMGWKKRLELAQLLYEAGEWERAIKEYRLVLEKQPRLIDVYLDLGNVQGLMESKSDSIATYQKALALAPEPATRHRISGLVEIHRGNYQRAISEFQEASKIEPTYAVHWHHLAFVYLLGDSPLEALRCFEECLKINPNDIAALTQLPPLSCDLGRTNEAEHYLDRALEQSPASVLSIKCLVDLRCKRRWVFGKDGKKTLALIQRAARLAGDSPEILASLASYHLCRGEWDEAISLLQTFTETHPASPEGWCCYAGALFQTGDVEAASEAIRQAYRLDPNFWKTNATACEIFGCQGPTPFLRLLLEKILERFSQRWSAWAVVGLAWMTGLKDAERAITISSRAPQLQPHLAEAWFKHARLLALAGSYHEAIVSAEVGWQQLPLDEDGSQSIPAAIGLAENYLLIRATGSEQVWMGEAARRLDSFIDLNPAEGHYWQGKLLELSGQRRTAVESYRGALEHNLFYPLRHDAEKALARLGTPLPRRDRSFPLL